MCWHLSVCGGGGGEVSAPTKGKRDTGRMFVGVAVNQGPSTSGGANKWLQGRGGGPSARQPGTLNSAEGLAKQTPGYNTSLKNENKQLYREHRSNYSTNKNNSQ